MGNTKDSLGDRLKSNYEDRQRFHLTRRTPVILRLDMRAGHTYLRGLKEPFSHDFCKVMNCAAIALAKGIQGTQIIYVQSDEISILLHDYKTLTSEAWFDYNVAKINSLAAAIASVEFSFSSVHIWKETRPAYFDCRCFNIPEAEVNNYFLWRQQDCTRNAIQRLGQQYFSSKELHGVSCNQIQDKLMLEHEVNFNDITTYYKRGRCIVKNKDLATNRSEWIVDSEIPIFSQDPSYIEDYLKVTEET